MKVNIPWSHLTDEQRRQVKAFYADELKSKDLFEHTLNTLEYRINITTGNIIFNKDF